MGSDGNGYSAKAELARLSGARRAG